MKRNPVSKNQHAQKKKKKNRKNGTGNAAPTQPPSSRPRPRRLTQPAGLRLELKILPQSRLGPRAMGAPPGVAWATGARPPERGTREAARGARSRSSPLAQASHAKPRPVPPPRKCRQAYSLSDWSSGREGGARGEAGVRTSGCRLDMQKPLLGRLGLRWWRATGLGTRSDAA